MGVVKMRIKQERGFTIVELLTAMVVTSFLLMAIYLAVNTTQRDSTAIERKVVAQADAKSALDIMALEIGMASYNANFEIEAWPAPGNSVSTCAALGADQKLRGIRVATANTIVVAMDANDSCKNVSPPSGCVGDGPNEIIRYDYNVITGADRYITRETDCGGGQPFLGDSIASGRPRNVIVNNADLDPVIPLFRYFDGSGNELIPGTATLTGTARRLNNATIPDIRRIEITLAVLTADPDTQGVRRQLFYSTSVIPRNHAITP